MQSSFIETSKKSQLETCIEPIDMASLAQIVLGTPAGYRRAMAKFLEDVSAANADAYQSRFQHGPGEGPWIAEAILDEVGKGLLRYSAPRACRAFTSIAKNTLGVDGQTRLTPSAARTLKRLVRADDLPFLADAEAEGSAEFDTVALLGYGMADDVVPFAGTSLVLTGENTGDAEWFSASSDPDGRTTDLYHVVVSVRRPVLAEIFPKVESSSR